MDLNSLKECTVLYVEDEASVREQTRLILADFVQEIAIAQNGQEGLTMALAHDYDLIITDIMMPEMDGITMAKALRKEHHKDVPIIITTAFTETEYLLEAIKLQVEGFITKPINIKDLINTIYTTMLPRIQNKKHT